MYAKLFASIYQGTLRGNTHGLVVFTNLLAHADSAGWVDIHPRAIAEETGLTPDQVRAAIGELEAPDIESRSPDEEGRRIVRLDAHRAWGWRVVNHAKYRAIRSEDDRREQNRLAQERFREKSKQSKPRKPMSAQAEAEAEAEAEAKAEAKAIKDPGGAPPAPPSDPSTGLRSGKPARKRAVKPVAPTAEVWSAYSQAYFEAYGVEPVRNAKVNAQMAQLVGRLGADESPGVARAYVSNRNGLYVSSKHCTDLLLRDAEKLRTEWVTGQTVTQTQANHADKTQTNANVFGPMLAEARAKEAREKHDAERTIN